MTAPVLSSQPKDTAARQDAPVCCYCDADLSCGACGMEQPHTDVSVLKAELAEWKQAASVEAGLRREFLARAEQAEREIAILEKNARVQATLLADTGRRVEELEAGEKALRDEIFCLRHIVTDVRIMANAGNFKQFEGEPWLRRARNIDLHHDPVATDVAFRAALNREAGQ